MKPRPIDIVEEGTRLLARVPLGGEPGLYAEMWKDDYDFLVKLGLSPNWACYRSKNAFYVTAAAVDTPSNRVLVARVLVDADAGQVVRYADGNPLNMRRENLRLVASAKAKSRARNFIRSKNILEISR
jgi:hypothetical protein